VLEGALGTGLVGAPPSGDQQDAPGDHTTHNGDRRRSGARSGHAKTGQAAGTNGEADPSVQTLAEHGGENHEMSADDE
jgi:hypothetical protein